MFTKAVTLAFIAVAAAVSTNQEGQGGHRQGNTCGNGGKIYCCNSKVAKLLNTDGIITSTVDPRYLLGKCNEITIPALSGSVVIKQQCSQEAVCCSNIEDNGLVNFGCKHLKL
ncbi:Hydrophobin [Penicillium cinerascens]|uniref:Hydrophobin n=1 Tax=Penicillium cinerascens TaxID=70096 RepID=A0A9W9J5K8_9EURO|nr:Hydrophobin [Penicillium cinerascens]KAJ5190964.1 Hydrophobin [Penicillium cinerascens]